MGAMPLQHEYDYPESDGQPMAESTVHWKAMVDTTEALVRRYATSPDVWVGSNLFVYSEQRKPGIAPDVLAVRGVAKWDRPTYKVWEEGGHVPFFVLEVTSKDTKREDTGKKKALYQAMGVTEYFLFDPLSEYLRPRLQGFELAPDGYRPIPRLGDGSVPSKATGILLRGEGTRLRLLDAATGKPLLWSDELDAARQEADAARLAAEAARLAAEERAEQETAARRALEEEIARLREQLGKR